MLAQAKLGSSEMGLPRIHGCDYYLLGLAAAAAGRGCSLVLCLRELEQCLHITDLV